MVVIAAMVGAGGLGQDIVQALQRIDVGLGFEAGLSVVILAIILDRMTNALGSLQDHSPVASIRARRSADRQPTADMTDATASSGR